jgi:hypothetical protein
MRFDHNADSFQPNHPQAEGQLLSALCSPHLQSP